MEDAHITTPSLRRHGTSRSLPGAAWTAGWSDLGLFAVFDGHGGEQVARYVERHFEEELFSFPVALEENGRRPRDIISALEGTFTRMDELLADSEKSIPELRTLGKSAKADPGSVGCTACVCCVTDSHYFVANAGDSRAVLCRGMQAVGLSEDHKPNDPIERKRIEAAGGYIEMSGPGGYRVNGNLNLSRALGDLNYKRGRGLVAAEQIISGFPDVLVEARRPDDRFVLICCDGVWDILKNQEAVDFVLEQVPALKDPSAEVRPEELLQAMEALLDRCLSPDLSKTNGYGGDNMTAVIFRLPQEQYPFKVSKLESIRGGGNIEVVIQLPRDSVPGDVFLRVSESTCSIHVGISGRGQDAGTSRVIDLRPHLQEGAVLAAGAPAARVEEGALRVKLAWERRS